MRKNIIASRKATAPFFVLALAALALCACALFGCQQSNPTEEKQADTKLEVSDKTQEASLGTQYFLIIGDDSWEDNTPGRSDLMLLARVDFDADQLTLVTIPRDTSYTWTDGSTIKANYAYLYGGADAACKAASDITGVDVTQYVVVNFDGLQKIVEHFDGVSVNLPYAVTYSFYTKDFPDEVYDAGEQTLTPWRAMAISRARTSYSNYGVGEDMVRQCVDRQMLTSFIKEAFTNPQNAASVIAELLPNVETNIPATTIAAWAADLAQASQLTVYGTSGPIDGSIDAGTELWLIPYSAEKWQALMDVVDAGGDPATVDAQFDGHVASDRAPINTKEVIDLA